LSFAIHPNWAFNYFIHPRFELSQLKDYFGEGTNISVSISDYFSKLIDQSMDWKAAEEINKHWGKQFALKGIMSVADAKKAVDIGATAIMLTFGMRNYYLGILDRVIIYPNTYYSNITAAYHKGEFNPRLKALVISWKDFKEGYADTTDNLNLGIHEFTHILQLNSKKFRDVSASIFSDGYTEIEQILKDDLYRNNLVASDYFRNYAYTNKYEFLAVLIENFIETPKDFKMNFPQLYSKVRQMLNYNFAGY
jgi:Mlc titration factor MtfA (ptsG expression regulator)